MESPAESSASGSKATVETLYGALMNGELEIVAQILAPDLEWWFHGPQHCQHMKRLLTGASSHLDFQFLPRRITGIGDWMFAEGWEGTHVYWVHVWTVQDGVITRFREYFNTWLTVKDLSPLMLKAKHEGLVLWRSRPTEHPNGSFPELLLAI